MDICLCSWQDIWGALHLGLAVLTQNENGLSSQEDKRILILQACSLMKMPRFDFTRKLFSM